MRMVLIALALIGVVAQATVSVAADRTEAVRFKAGASSAKISSSIKGDNAVNYTLDARAGQVMSVVFSGNNGSCYFNLLPPGSNEAIHIGSSEGDTFKGTLSVGGTYTAQVYLMRNAARRNETCKFTIDFAISGASNAASEPAPAIDERAMLIACTDAVQAMYGVDVMKVRLANEGQIDPTADGFRVKGIADKGAEGKKDFACLYGKNGSLKDVMALTSDGAL
ncbi:MAG: hypothetical protein ACK50Q_11495 [Labrys sp. (in: a-proteobacteria)]|jgi:hypothetical protein